MSMGAKETVTRTVREQLNSFAPGEKLPGVAELCETFGVGTATAVGAMGTLVAEGLVESRRGPLGGYFRTARPLRDRAGVLRSVATQLEEAAEITRAIVDQIEDATGSIRDASAPTDLFALIEEAVGDLLTGYSVDADELPGAVWDSGSTVPLTPIQVDSVTSSRGNVQIATVVRADGELPSRDAVLVDDDIAGLDLETNAFVAVSQTYSATITVSRMDLVGGVIELGSIQDVTMAERRS